MKPITGRTAAVAASLALSFMGCADRTGACIEEYSTEAGYGHEGDQVATECIDPCHSTAECDPPTVAEIQDECIGDGHPCSEPLITRNAAMCISTVEGIDLGVERLYADLLYDENLHRPVWEVRSIVTEDGEMRDGDRYLIDAVTGEVLHVGSWGETDSGSWTG